MTQQAFRGRRTVIVAAALLLTATGCSSTTAGTAGTGSGTTGAGSAGTTAVADPSGAGESSVLADLTSALSAADSLASQANAANGGTATITVDGETTTVTLDPCYIVDTSDVNLSISSDNSNGLLAMLPPEPGPFTKDDLGHVMLPPPSGDDEYRGTSDISGQWTRDGDGASGHIEGSIHLLSGITSADDPAFPFSVDFECTGVDDLTG